MLFLENTTMNDEQAKILTTKYAIKLANTAIVTKQVLPTTTTTTTTTAGYQANNFIYKWKNHKQNKYYHILSAIENALIVVSEIEEESGDKEDGVVAGETVQYFDCV